MTIVSRLKYVRLVERNSRSRTEIPPFVFKVTSKGTVSWQIEYCPSQKSTPSLNHIFYAEVNYVTIVYFQIFILLKLLCKLHIFSRVYQMVMSLIGRFYIWLMLHIAFTLCMRTVCETGTLTPRQFGTVCFHIHVSLYNRYLEKLFLVLRPESVFSVSAYPMSTISRAEAVSRSGKMRQLIVSAFPASLTHALLSKSLHNSVISYY